jgi:hypothetical protein
MRTLRIEFLSFLALAVSAAAFANEFGDLPQVREITRGQAGDIVTFIERRAECNHWGGEEGDNDKERAEHISQAVEKVRCGSLDADQQALERKYKDNRGVLDAIGKANALAL